MLHGVEIYAIREEGVYGGSLTSQVAAVANRQLAGASLATADPFLPPEKLLLAPKQTFCRLFDKGGQADPAALTRLGLAMESDTAIAGKKDSSIPAGFTYFGQFLDHDITFDKTPLTTTGSADPGGAENHRTPTLDLDSLYGGGPAIRPDLYASDGASFRLGDTAPSQDQSGNAIPVSANDLPRQSSVAVIGDPRNDENLVVAQLHLAFLKFHNSFVNELRAAFPSLPADSLFRRAREQTVKHYQRIVLRDFLPKVIDPNALEAVLSIGHRIFRPELHSFMPIEFSVAAYRMGHSMVRPSYDWNRVFHSKAGALAPATLELLFEFTHFSGSTAPGDAPFGGFADRLPSNWPVDWRLMFEVEGHGPPAGFKVNRARQIDTSLAFSLQKLPEFAGSGVTDAALISLASRNLLRARLVELADGLRAADAIIDAGLDLEKLTPDQLRGGAHGAVLEDVGLLHTPPLWYYILREGEVANGERLGPVGSSIVAETIVALIRNSDVSVLADPSINNLSDVPRYSMSDMLKRVNDLNPVG